MPESPDLEQYAEYYHLSEQLVADATKTELVECARLLDLHPFPCRHGLISAYVRPRAGFSNRKLSTDSCPSWMERWSAAC